MSEGYWLNGYYPPDMDKAGGFYRWEDLWSLGPHAEEDWVWFDGDRYTEEEARKVLKDKPWGVKGDDNA